MKIFLSAELEGAASSKWFELQKEFTPILSKINDRDYGDGLVSIAIISIIMRNEFFENNAYKERVFYDKKNKEADVRLKIDYKKFVKADKDERKKIYINHIIDSIHSLKYKVYSEFNFEQLIFDIENLLLKSLNKD